MAKLQQFREQVTIYRKRQRTADGRQYTLEDLGKAIGLSSDELGHRLRGNGKLPLSQDNVFAIVLALAEWEALTWDEAVELLTWMDYPLDQPGWRVKLQRVLAPLLVLTLVHRRFTAVLFKLASCLKLTLFAPTCLLP
jgi:hypothetical protein